MIRSRDLLFVVACWTMLLAGVLLAIFVDDIDTLSMIYGVGVGVGLIACFRISTDFMAWANRRGDREFIFDIDNDGER